MSLIPQHLLQEYKPGRGGGIFPIAPGGGPGGGGLAIVGGNGGAGIWPETTPTDSSKYVTCVM